MFFEKRDNEDTLKKNEKEIKQLELEIERLDREMYKMFKELNMSPEEVRNFLDEPTNFTKEMWTSLQNEKKKIEEQLEKKLSHVRNLAKAEEAYKQRNLPHYAIFCR